MRVLSSVLMLAMLACVQPVHAQDPDPIFKKSTVWNMLTPDDKLATYAIDDPAVEGVACYYTVPEKGGVKGMLGVAEEHSDVSLACRQVGPISFKEPLKQQTDVFSERMSFIFKTLHVVRVVDKKRNTIVYLTYSDRIVSGSPKNAVTAVPMPAGTTIPVK